MKKIIFSGFMGAMLAVPAFAVDGTSLTTKNYVDDGLRAVYSASKSYTDSVITGTQENPGLNPRVTQLETDVDTLADTIGDSDMGTTAPTVTGAISELKQQIESLDGITDTNTTYAAGDGITISGENNAVSITGLSGTTGANAGKMYIYQNGALTEMPVASTWSTDGLPNFN